MSRMSGRSDDGAEEQPSSNAGDNRAAIGMGLLGRHEGRADQSQPQRRGADQVLDGFHIVVLLFAPSQPIR